MATGSNGLKGQGDADGSQILNADQKRKKTIHANTEISGVTARRLTERASITSMTVLWPDNGMSTLKMTKDDRTILGRNSSQLSEENPKSGLSGQQAIPATVHQCSSNHYVISCGWKIIYEIVALLNDSSRCEMSLRILVRN
jgi:hypothetical protein